MYKIALFDITGIQDFIFASNKLKENIGASLYVAELFNSMLSNQLRLSAGEKKVITNWDEQDRLSILDDESVATEIIYLGGGNAMLIFRDESLLKELVFQISAKVLKESYGQLAFAVGVVDSDLNESFEEIQKKLVEDLAIKKGELTRTSPMLGIGITRQGATDDLPAKEKYLGPDQNKGEYLSASAIMKRDIAHRAQKGSRKAEFVYRILPNEYAGFEFNIDDLGQVEGENHIATIHIDGNNMGKTIRQILKNTTSFEDSAQAMRSISKKINESYETVMRETIKSFMDSVSDEEFRKKHSIKNPGEKIIPIRPVVMNGDDITLITDGRLGISFAEEFLKCIVNTPMEVEGKSYSLSASAGIFISKSHFPFHRAYQMAEDLCSSAKKKGKIIAANCKLDDPGCWIDFHVAQSGVTNSISAVRKQYSVGSQPPDPVANLYEPDNVFEQYNLLWRPWKIDENEEGLCEIANKYNWKHFKHIFNEFSKWPKNRVKRLRNELIHGFEAAEKLVQEFISRDKKLPKFQGSNDLQYEENHNPTRQTIYFDALELTDFYIQIGGKK